MLLKVTGEHKDGFRDHLIFALALGTGLREHELVALNVGDVLSSNGKARTRIQLRVYKQSSDKPAMQEVILSETLKVKVARFIQWKHERGEAVSPDAPLFISRKNNRLSTRQVRNLFREWQKRSGFERLYRMHTIRHTAISNIYQQTKDIRLTQRFARHKSVVSTERYAHARLEDLVRAVQELRC